MKMLINLDEKLYTSICSHKDNTIWNNEAPYVSIAIKNGTPLPPNTMILDKAKLERDTEWDDFYDGYMSYSRLALEAAEIKEGE